MLPTFKPVFQKVDPLKNDGMKYRLAASASYYSERYDKFVHLKVGMLSDGATMAFDIPESWSYWVHDSLCSSYRFGDGSKCTALQASRVLHDILEEENRHIRKWTWRLATFLFGSWGLKRQVGWA